MLEKPDIDDNLILSRLADAYGLHAEEIRFLPLGADVNTAVYRVTAGGTAYFLKLRKGAFDEITVSVPHFLRAQGIEAIIAPLETITHQLWAGLGDFTMILYPFVEGRDGYETAPSDAQWLKFGAALRSLHTALTGVQGTALTGVQGTTLTPLRAFEAQGAQGAAALPTDLAGRLPGETFPAEWREQVAGFQAQVEENSYPDPIAARVADLMRARREEIHRLVARTETLARALRERPPAPGWEPVLCHTDLHPGNLLLGANDALYIVDWDNPVLAPRERDLMLIGGCAAWNDPRAVALFYQGYGPVEIDPAALAYYRFERIVEDIAAFCQQLLLPEGYGAGREDRERSLGYFTGIFAPGHELELAWNGDASNPVGHSQTKRVK